VTWLIECIPGRFVDVGCGDGVATNDLARRYGFNMVGVDELEKAIAWARDRPASAGATGVARRGREGGGIAGVSFSVGSAYSLPLADRSVDGWVLLLHPVPSTP